MYLNTSDCEIQSASKFFPPANMASLLVRYLYRKYKDWKAADEQTDISLAPSQTLNRDVSGLPLSTGNATAISTTGAPNGTEAQNTKSKWRWRLALTIALFVPIFLETLDYTGE